MSEVATKMNVLKVDFKAADADKRFTESLVNTGFAVLENHPLDEKTVSDFYAAWTDFFENGDTEGLMLDIEKQDGLISFEQSEKAKDADLPDLKSFFHYYPWGRCPSHLREMTQSMYDQMTQIAVTLLDWVEKNTPPEIAKHYSMPLSKMITDSARTLLRVLYYPALKGDEPLGAVRAAAHGDINLLTVLPAATQAGLQVQDVDGDWHDVPCDYGSLAVNTGDMLSMASNGYFPSTIHRVINPTGDEAKKARLSLPLFLHPRDDVRLSDTHTATEYRMERLRELGLV